MSAHIPMGLVALLYLVLASVYAQRRLVVMDEFDSLRRVQVLLGHVPYRDYQPYKTLLGQLLQAPWVAASGSSFDSIIVVRLLHVALTAAGIWFAGVRLSRRYPRLVVACGLLALALHTNFLERSGAFRLDMMTALVGLCALVLRLEGKQRSCAFLFGLSFFVSQKGALLIFAYAAAESSSLLFDRSRQNWRRLLVLCAFGLAPAVGYLLAWSLVAPFDRVFDTVFLARSREVADVNATYGGVRKIFWQSTLRDNTPYYALLALGLLISPWLAARQPTGDRRLALLLYVFTFVLSCLFVAYPQPWPYFFVLLLPTTSIFLIHFLWQLCRLSPRGGLAVTLYLAALACVVALVTVPKRLNRTLDSQKRIASFGTRYLDSEERYLAGVALIPTRDHVSGLEWLDARALRRLSEGESSTALADLERQPPALLVHNYRMASLPVEIKEWLSQRYVPVGGNFSVLGCTLSNSKKECVILRGGRYQWRSQGASLQVAGRTLSPRETVTLEPGILSVSTTGEGELIRSVKPDLLAEVADEPDRELFRGVY